MNRKFYSLAFILLLSISPVFAQSKMGVNVSGDRAFVNVVDEGLTFNGAASLDAQGWPKSDFSLNIDWRLVAEWVGPTSIDDPEAYRINKSGVHHCSFEGQADITASGATISNKSYNAGTNITVFDITISSASNGCVFWQLSFNNTKRTSTSATNTGITKLRMLRPGYDLSTTQVFTTEYINMCKSANFACFRYYPVNNVWDGDPVYPATTTWANRKLPTDASQGNMRGTIGKSEGWCWEYVILLANTLNKDIWICVNSSADDNYITQLATKLKNELNGSINIYVEYCNEVWAAYNPGTNWVDGQAKALGITFDQNYARNVVRVSNLFKGVFGSAAINTRIRVVLGAQKGWIGRSDNHLPYINTTFGTPKTFIYAISPATYFSGTGATITEALNACHTNIMSEYDDVNDGSSMAQFVKKASDWGLKLVSYEGQEHANIGSTTNLGVDIGKHRDKRMASEQYANFQSFFDNGGELACQFGIWATYTRYGCWGLTDDPANPDRNYKFKAARTLAGDVTNAMPVPAAPIAPTCLTISNVSSTVQKLTWVDNATTEDGYEIWYLESGTSTWKYGATVGTNISTYNFTLPNSAKTYQYKVRAYNFSQWSAYNQPCAGDIQPPTAPTLSSTGKTTTTVSLSWTASTDNVGVTGYFVYNGSNKVNTSLTAGTTYTVSGLTAGTAYNFTVKASDAAGNLSVASNVVTVTTTANTDTQAPTAPTLSSTGKTTISVTLSWSGASDNVAVTGYNVYNGAALVTSTASTSYIVTGLTAGTAYTFTVKAKDAAGNVSAASNSLSVTTNTADTQAPTAPTLSTTGKTSTTVILSWTAARDNVGVTGYDVYRGATLVISTASTSYTVTGLTASTAYTFTVKAKDAAGNVSAASNSLSVTTNPPADTQAPTAPTNLSSTGKTTTTVTLSWTAATDNVGVTGYNIYKAGILAGSTTTATSYTITGLTANTAYAFTVKAKDAAGNLSVASNSLSVTTAANTSSDTQAPTAATLSSSGKTSTSVSLSWSGATDNVAVTGYDIYNGATKINSTPMIGNSFTIGGLVANQTYTFTVKARDAAGNTSVASNVVTVTTASTDLPSFEESLSVGPNPSEGIFLLRIENDDIGNYTMKVFDVIGTCVLNRNIQKGTSLMEENLDLTNLANGVYYIVLEFGKSKVVKKVIKF